PHPLALLENPAFLGLIAALVISFIVGWVITPLVGAVFTGAVIDAAAAAHLGHERSLSQSFVTGFGSSLRIFFAGVLVTIAITLIWIVLNIATAFVNNGTLLFLIFCVYLCVKVYVQASWFVSPVLATMQHPGPIS